MTVGDKQDIQLISYSADCNGKSRIVVVVLSCCCCAQLLLLCSVVVVVLSARVECRGTSLFVQFAPSRRGEYQWLCI